jgi:signal peptidase I
MRSLSLLKTAHAAKCELAAEVLRSSRKLRLQVTGWSMLPSIWPGDTLLIEPAKYDEVASGDLVLFLRERRLFVHRAVGRDPGDWRILTRGDAMRREDPPVNEAELLGKVTLVWRGGKCSEPARSLAALERVVAHIVARFELAARLVVVVHGWIQSQQVQTV